MHVWYAWYTSLSLVNAVQLSLSGYKFLDIVLLKCFLVVV